MRRLERGAALHAALCALVAAQGCILVDYDEHPFVVDGNDGGFQWPPVDGGDEEMDARVLDAADARALDAADAQQGDAEDAAHEDAVAPPDATADASADDAASTADAAADASPADAATDGATTCAPNACGGCTTLPHAVGAACGTCGLGQYACAGADAVSCIGGNATPKASGGTLLLDDLEDGDQNVRSDSGFSGKWFTVSDGSSTGMLHGGAPTPTAGGAHGSAYAMHVAGSGFTTWGAGVAASLNAYGCTYDAAQETGLSATVKGTGKLLVSLATRSTVPVASGGNCTGNCNDHFNVIITLTSTWTPKMVPFSSLRQTGWGTVTTFKANELMYVQFSFGPNVTFDVSVDDVAFY